MRHRPTTRVLIGATAAATLALTGCGDDGGGQGTSPSSSSSSSSSGQQSSGSGHGGSSHEMNHPANGGPVPSGMTTAEHPKYAVGSTVTLTADHMPGMKGSKAEVVGAYDTTAYAVTYTPTNGGTKVKNHKWVVQEELEGNPDEPVAKGDRVTLTADHMKNMKGAEATIDSSTDQTVYVVDIHMDGMTMKNHKWVVEDEMKPAS